MITDKVSNIKTYRNIPELKEVIDYISTHDITVLPIGRTDINGNDLYVDIQSYETKSSDEGRLEAHDKYIDLQLMIEGEEIIGYAPRQDLSEPAESLPEKDICFYSATYSECLLKQGMFAVYFPQDAHAPCILSKNKSSVRKAVFKIRRS